MCEPDLGMDVDSANAIMKKVDVIIQSAGNTNFDDRYDSLLEANVNGLQRLMRFAKRYNNLILFVHISTAGLLLNLTHKHLKRLGLERGTDPVLISYGKGQLPAFLGDPEIPVDMVVNTIITATAKHGTQHKPELSVYHVASSIVNPS
ncbi:UNVERIFIED_CONTAM: Fatty acyl-CoA reductase 2 [Sesamum latifolium]|uniref:Fatty acyl-CoA reductase n=1 Tax=Sesamum latifolium TaxID=2727402 RepID=A0AAW2TBT0_9LAMI